MVSLFVVVNFRGWGSVERRFCLLDGPGVGLLGVVRARFGGCLEAHQLEGAAFLASRFGGLLGDEMGLGKTRAAAAALVLAGGRSLVICPAGGRSAWASEIAAVAPDVVVTCPASPRELDTTTGGIVVIAFSRLAEFRKALRTIPFNAAVIDEAQFVKNASERQRHGATSRHRTEHTFAICRYIRRVYLLSGTPLPSKPRELFNLLRLTRHPLGRSFRAFATRYCGGTETPWGFSADGCTAPRELSDQLVGWLLQRTKKQVFPNMPPKRCVARKVRLTPQTMSDYRHEWFRYASAKAAQDTLGRWTRARQMVRVGRLRQYLSAAKAEHAIRLAQEQSGKVVIFTSYRSTLKRLAAALPGAETVTYHGGLNETARNKVVREFQTNPRVRYFLAILDAAKTGLTLTAADTSIFVDLAWTPADLKQGEDRIHRIGQTKPCTIYYLVVPETVDDSALAILAEKRKVARAVLEGGAWHEPIGFRADHAAEILKRALGDIPRAGSVAAHDRRGQLALL